MCNPCILMQLKFCMSATEVFAGKSVEEISHGWKKTRIWLFFICVSFHPCECKHFPFHQRQNLTWVSICSPRGNPSTSLRMTSAPITYNLTTTHFLYCEPINYILSRKYGVWSFYPAFPTQIALSVCPTDSKSAMY